jgi:uncharacterized protein YicC (UPF0701 family)
MKKQQGRKKIDQACIREELDRLLEQVKESKSALKKLSVPMPRPEEKK